MKSLVIVNADTLEVICTEFCEGKKHDFTLFKDSGIKALEQTSILVDSGFQGLQKLHENTWLPHKKTKTKELTDEEKSENSLLASERIYNEHVIGCLKKFSIISCRYRNRRKRFGLRFNLIAGIYNFEL